MSDFSFSIADRNVTLRIIKTNEYDKWDKFVHSHSDGTIYHHSAWIRLLVSTYNYKPVLITVENNKTGQLEGIIPFILINSRLTGKRMV